MGIIALHCHRIPVSMIFPDDPMNLDVSVMINIDGVIAPLGDEQSFMIHLIHERAVLLTSQNTQSTDWN